MTQGILAVLCLVLSDNLMSFTLACVRPLRSSRLLPDWQRAARVVFPQ